MFEVVAFDDKLIERGYDVLGRVGGVGGRGFIQGKLGGVKL